MDRNQINLSIMKTFIYKILLCSCLLVAYSCSDKEENESFIYPSETDKSHIYLERLNILLDRFLTLQAEAVYGDKAGNYPLSSKTILEDEIAYLESLIESIQTGSVHLKDYEVDRIILDVNKTEEEFLSSKRTEDFKSVPAELIVNGKSGGYIDFGVHPEYSNFSEGFTVDLWLKFEDLGNFDFILSTFIDTDTDNPRLRQGWAINYYGEGGASLLRMTYALGVLDLYEPGINYNRENREWMHIAMVWNPSKANNSTTFKMYMNGNLVKEEQIGRTDLNPNIQNASMIGFNHTKFDGSMATDGKGTYGRMKYLHIWKTAKTQEEIQKIMNSPLSIVGNEADLICGWNFDSTVSDNNNIIDLTGKYKAQLKGDFQWVNIN